MTNTFFTSTRFLPDSIAPLARYVSALGAGCAAACLLIDREKFFVCCHCGFFCKVRCGVRSVVINCVDRERLADLDTDTQRRGRSKEVCRPKRAGVAMATSAGSWLAFDHSSRELYEHLVWQRGNQLTESHLLLARALQLRALKKILSFSNLDPRPIDKDDKQASCTMHRKHGTSRLTNFSETDLRRKNAFMNSLHTMGLSSEISSTHEQHAGKCMHVLTRSLGHTNTQNFLWNGIQAFKLAAPSSSLRLGQSDQHP